MDWWFCSCCESPFGYLEKGKSRRDLTVSGKKEMIYVKASFESDRMEGDHG